MFNNNTSINTCYRLIDICQLLQFRSTLYGQLSTFKWLVTKSDYLLFIPSDYCSFISFLFLWFKWKGVYECPSESANICDGLERKTKIFVLRTALSCQNLYSAISVTPVKTNNISEIYSDMLSYKYKSLSRKLYTHNLPNYIKQFQVICWWQNYNSKRIFDVGFRPLQLLFILRCPALKEI